MHGLNGSMSHCKVLFTFNVFVLKLVATSAFFPHRFIYKAPTPPVYRARQKCRCAQNSALEQCSDINKSRTRMLREFKKEKKEKKF